MFELLQKSTVKPCAEHVWVKDVLKVNMLPVHPFAKNIWETRESDLEVSILE